MKYLFSDGALTELRHFCTPHTLFGFDFDGTLAPIRANPLSVRLSKVTGNLLRALDQHASVAVVSGRAASDLLSLIGFRPRYLVGNHGIENPLTKEADLNRARKICRHWLTQLRSCSSHDLKISIEDKQYTLSIHYRRSQSPQLAQEIIGKHCAQLKPVPHFIAGRFIVNLLPIETLNKGTAVSKLVKIDGAHRAFFIGDDRTDEDVFCLKKPALFSVCVRRQAHSKARFYTRSQSEIDLLLRTLVQLTARPTLNNHK